MKKIAALLSCSFLVLGLATACKDKTETNSFTDLKKDEALFVGTEDTFVNLENTKKETVSLSYTVSVKYSLVRSSYEHSNAIEYEGYYYYWNTAETTDEAILGNKTTTTTLTHSYLPYGQDENIVVRSETKTTTSYDYKGGWIEKDFSYELNLNNYFSNFAALKTACPELASKIDVSGKKKYYVDVTTPEKTYVQMETFESTYYYILEN